MADEFNPVEKYNDYVLKRYTGIATCRSYSVERIRKLRALVGSYFDKRASAREIVSCVAVCGSLGRLEASPNSDFDIITVGLGDSDVSQIHKDLIDLAHNELGVPLPNPKGAFAIPSSSTILSKASGDQMEGNHAFTQRALFVLETKCIWNEANYDQNMRAIIKAYGEHVANDSRKNYVFLLNDMIRYFRTICVNYQFNTTGSEWGKWPLRNVKLRHSRVLMYFSMVAVLGELSVYYKGDKAERLLKYIKLTPLERIFKIYQDQEDHSWFRFFGHYDTFLRIMSDPASRARLKELDYADRYQLNEFATLKANSDGLAAEIVRFIMSRRARWSERYFEYLLI